VGEDIKMLLPLAASFYVNVWTKHESSFFFIIR